jgi:hypothetical protein
MTKLTIETDHIDADITVEIQPALLNCIVAALLAAAPTFINALMTCLASQPGPASEYKPGNRQRCTDAE